MTAVRSRGESGLGGSNVAREQLSYRATGLLLFPASSVLGGDALPFRRRHEFGTDRIGDRLPQNPIDH